MGEEVERVEFTRADRARYREQVHRNLDAFARMLRESRFDVDRPLTGVEIELNLVDENSDPAMKNAEVLAAISDDAFQTELGQFNVEINVPPAEIGGNGLDRMETRIRDSLNAAEEKAAKTGSHMLVVGILPTLFTEHMSMEALSANPRYALLNDQIFAAQAIAGVQLAVGANSPFLFGKELMRETRIALFEQTTDTRTNELKAQGVRPRVWFGERWVTSIFDLFAENARYYPALLPVVS